MQVGEEGQRAVLGCCGFQDRRLVGQDGREEMSLKCKELAELKTELFLPRQRAPRAPAGGQREPTHGGVPAFPDFKDKLLSSFHSVSPACMQNSGDMVHAAAASCGRQSSGMAWNLWP